MYQKIIVVTGLLLVFTLALVSDASAASPNCEKQSTSRRIKTIATMILSQEKEKFIRSCYKTLSDKDKAQVFEELAAQRGLLEKLREETENNQHLSHGESMGAALASWKQLIERVPFSAIGKTLRSVTNAFQDKYCDGTDPDIDYTFVVLFPYSITNPDSLRSFAGVTAVDAMLTWYQINYGGISGKGTTTSGYVYLCIGDTGVSTAGGVQAVRNALKLHDNN